MNKTFKRLLISGASLLMLASAGAGFNNVNAARSTHRFEAAPVHYISSKYLPHHMKGFYKALDGSNGGKFFKKGTKIYGLRKNRSEGEHDYVFHIAGKKYTYGSAKNPLANMRHHKHIVRKHRSHKHYRAHSHKHRIHKHNKRSHRHYRK